MALLTSLLFLFASVLTANAAALGRSVADEGFTERKSPALEPRQQVCVTNIDCGTGSCCVFVTLNSWCCPSGSMCDVLAAVSGQQACIPTGLPQPSTTSVPSHSTSVVVVATPPPPTTIVATIALSSSHTTEQLAITSILTSLPSSITTSSPKTTTHISSATQSMSVIASTKQTSTPEPTTIVFSTTEGTTLTSETRNTAKTTSPSETVIPPPSTFLSTTSSTYSSISTSFITSSPSSSIATNTFISTAPSPTSVPPDGTGSHHLSVGDILGISFAIFGTLLAILLWWFSARSIRRKCAARKREREAKKQQKEARNELYVLAKHGYVNFTLPQQPAYPTSPSYTYPPSSPQQRDMNPHTGIWAQNVDRMDEISAPRSWSGCSPERGSLSHGPPPKYSYKGPEGAGG